MNFELTETMFIALVTASASFFAALAGVITAIITSKMSESSRITGISVQATMDARIRSYAQFLDSCVEFEKNFSSKEALAKMVSAKNVAAVVSSEKTTEWMNIYSAQLVATDFRSENTRSAKNALLASMRDDIQSVKRPKVTRK